MKSKFSAENKNEQKLTKNENYSDEEEEDVITE